jgi:hypothetical protein
MTDVVVSMSCDGCAQTVVVPVGEAHELFLEDGPRDPKRMIVCNECNTWFEVMVVCATKVRVPMRLAAIQK